MLLSQGLADDAVAEPPGMAAHPMPNAGRKT